MEKEKEEKEEEIEKLCSYCGLLFKIGKSSQIKYCSQTCRKKGKGKNISATKRKLLFEDSTYLEKRRNEGRNVGKQINTKDQVAKQKKTMKKRYTKEQRSEWAAQGRRGKAPWNKGLSKETDERVAKQAAMLIGHPPNPGSGVGKNGYRNDIKLYVRSTWEANFVRILNKLQLDYKYEPMKFNLLENGKVIDTYLPDFYISNLDLWIEISGYVTKQKTLRIKMFESQHYPIFHITKDFYYELRDMYKNTICNWEQ